MRRRIIAAPGIYLVYFWGDRLATKHKQTAIGDSLKIKIKIENNRKALEKALMSIARKMFGQLLGRNLFCKLINNFFFIFAV